MSEEMDLSQRLEDIDEELNEENNQIETKIVFKSEVPKSDRQLSEEELYSVYQSFDINFDELNRRYSLWRLEVIHIRGVQNMSSEDVLKYFEDFDPNSIEWVNDLSCNVVFNDKKASAIAMRGLTTALVVKNKLYLNCDFQIDVLDSDSLPVPVPPGFRWRLGITHMKSKALLLRFATHSDKKIRGSRGMSEYYNKYGITSDKPRNGSTLQTRKRQLIRDETEDESIEDMTDSAIDLKTKRIRMRMRADDELDLIRQRPTDRILTTGANDVHSQRKSIWERLDNHSLGDDSQLIQISVKNERNNYNNIWRHRRERSERPLRSSISVVKSDKNDLRNKITQRMSSF